MSLIVIVLLLRNMGVGLKGFRKKKKTYTHGLSPFMCIVSEL